MVLPLKGGVRMTRREGLGSDRPRPVVDYHRVGEGRLDHGMVGAKGKSGGRMDG